MWTFDGVVVTFDETAATFDGTGSGGLNVLGYATFTLAGQNVAFSVGNGTPAYTIYVDTGVFNLFGATEQSNLQIDAAVGLFAFTGEPVLFNSTNFFLLSCGFFSLNGQPATFGDSLLGGSGVFSLAGQNTTYTIGLATGVYDYFSLIGALSAYATGRIDISPYVQYFVQLAEERIYEEILAGKFGSGVGWMESYYSTTIANGSCAVPSGFVGVKDFQVLDGNGSIFTLLWKDPQWIYSNYPVQQPTGIPSYIARDGTPATGQVFIFGPYPDSNYTVQGTYYQKSAPLSPTNTSTWMTTYCPDVLLAACMLELQPFLKDTKSASMWQSIYDYKLGGLVNLDKAEGFMPGVLTMEVA